MKKLMMVIAVVGCAVATHAATVDWSFSQVVRTDKAYSDLTGYSAYLFTASAWSTVENAVSGGALDSASFTGYSGSAAIQVATAATVKTFSTGSSVIKSTQNLSGDSYYIVLADLTNGGDVWAKAVTATIYDETADPVPSHTAGTWSITKVNTGAYLGTGNSTGWTVSVPEPTSGLMLLLGIAGLALKRKRA